MKLEKLGNNKTAVMTGNKKVYFSYNTPVVVRVGQQVYKTEQYFSPTTSRHINIFLEMEPHRTGAMELTQEQIEELAA